MRVVGHVMIQPIKLFYQLKVIHARWTKDNNDIEFPEHLKPIPQILINCCSTGLVIKHVKYLPKVFGRIAIRPCIPKQVKNHIISVILLLDIFIPPVLTKYVNGLDTKPLSVRVCQSSPASHITNYFTDTKVVHIISLLKRLDLTWAFTALRNVWGSIHSVHPGRSIHGPVGPYFASGDADSRGNNTVLVWAVEVQPPPHPGYGC
nr:AC5 [East African cassava mosaic virus]